MSTSHKKEILELLESGKINAAEAARMLNDLPTEKTPTEEETVTIDKITVPDKIQGPDSSAKSPSMFRVRVRNMETGKNKVSVNIPVRMLRLGLRLGSRFSPELEGLEFNDITEMMSDMEGGMLVEVEDEENQEHVQIYFE
jgi:polyhydroxyalkanoate synthesis regulator phasin